MSTFHFHYDQTPLPVGVPIRMNGSDESYSLGLYDGALYDDQYADEPEVQVLFESPEGARRWLEAATTALSAYIKSGDRQPRLPDPNGWSSE